MTEDDAVPTAILSGSSEIVTLSPGARLAGRFVVGGQLGEGGTGTVYAARDQLLAEDVAIKLLFAHADDAQPAGALERLRDEVRAARRIAHPNVCRVHDLCEAGGIVFVVMEHLAGETLRRRLRRGLTLPESVEIVRQLGAGLAAAHRAGVIDCDVKPENAIVVGDRVVLTDFGIARIGASQAEGGPGKVEGTPAYMAPEQLLGETVDERADVYALATVACELLLGRHPFRRAADSLERFQARVLDEPPDLDDSEPADLAPEARAEVARALARGLAKTPADRWESVDALVAALLAAIGKGALAATGRTAPEGAEQPTPQPTPTLVRRAAARRVATIVHLLVEEVFGEDADEELAAERAESLLGAAEAALADAGGAVVSRGPRVIVCVFGATASRGDEPLRAADSARAVASAAGDDVAVRAGIDTGRLLVRPGATRAQAVVVGDALARAAALATAAAPGQVLASHRTARHLVRRFSVEDAGAGVKDGVRVGARRRAELALARVPLLGRDDELARIVDELAVAKDGPARAALIVGPPGVGKSRLRREVVDLVSSRGSFAIAAATAAPDDALSSYAVARALLRGMLGVRAVASERLSDEEAASAAKRGLGDDADPALAEALAGLLAGGPPRAGSLAAAAARACLARVARTRPLLVVLDDLHWADDATLGVVEAIARGEVEAPIALLAQARPELVERRPRAAKAFALRVDLGGLEPRRARELAALALGDASTPERARLVAEASDGNPFFIEELARDVRERKDAEAALPSTVEEAIQARLDRLAEPAREVLRAASVLGREFRRADLVLIMPDLDERSADRELAELEQRGVVFALPPDASFDDRYLIKHALIRDVAYRELAPAARRALHAAAAKLWSSDEEGREVGELARHLEGADDRPGAVAAYRRAGELAEAQGSPAGALRCLARARALGASDVPLLLALGRAALEAAQYGELDAAVDEAIGRAAGVELAQAYDLKASAAKDHGRWDDAVALTRRGLELVTDADDVVVAAKLHGSLGWVLAYIQGKLDEGLPECEHAVALLEGTPHRAALARAYSALGAAYMRAGRWGNQRRANEQNLGIGEEIGSLENRARAHLNLGVNLLGLGETEGAAEHSRRAIAIHERMCTAATVALARNNLGFALVDLGRLDEAQRELDEALRISDLLGGLYFRFEALVSYARLLARRGDLAGAGIRAEAAIAQTQADGGRIDEGVSRKTLAAIRSLAGDHDAATKLLDEAEALLDGADLGELARIVAERGRAALRRGDGEAAARLFADARAKLEALGAKLELAKLEDPSWL